MKFCVQVPGSTSNLGAGFDTISAALGIYLHLQIEVTGNRTLEWPVDWTLDPRENMIELAYRAAARKLGLSDTGLRIEVDNQIPFKRGLGSSGAAIIAGIKMAERLAQRSLTREEVFELAYPLEGHPDNLAASLLGGWVVSLTTDSGMRAKKIDCSLNLRFVVAIPELTISTSEARNILPDHYSLADAVFNMQRSALLVHALHTGQRELFREACRDRLHQPYRAQLVPGLSSLLERERLPDSLDKVLLSVTISGSGSCTLAVADSTDPETLESIGRWMQRTFSRKGIASEFRILELDRMGAVIR